MFSKLNCRMFMGALALFQAGGATFGAASMTKDGSEYPILFSLPGDQTAPHLKLGPTGGFIVTHDNSTDGDGLGIRARRINGDFSASRATFQVNADGAGDQMNPQVALLSNGGSVFVWQGGKTAQPNIYARFMNSASTFIAPEVVVNSAGHGAQIHPSVTVLPDDTVVIVWQGFGQDGSMFGVLGQRFNSQGQKLGGEFKVNQFTLFGQRNPVVTSLGAKGFVVAWISEEQRHSESVDVMLRLFSPTGAPLGNEFRLSTSERISGNPQLTTVGDSGFCIAWDERDHNQADSGYDVFARCFDTSGAPVTGSFKLNSFTEGDQWAPKLASVGSKIMAVWTSMGQDRSTFGVFGQLFNFQGQLEGSEFQVNTTFISYQKEPTITSNGSDRFVVAWTSFGGGINSFDLFAQRYFINEPSSLTTPAKPFLGGLSQNSFSVSWPELLGHSISQYEIYVDNSSVPVVNSSGYAVISNNNWLPGSTHSVRILYKLADGRKSPLSEAASVKTWGADSNADQLPDDWQTSFWGKQINWPPSTSDSDGDGASNHEEFLAGTDPTNPSSSLRNQLFQTEQGWFLRWNTEPGNVYQVQSSSDLIRWFNQGNQRFAASTQDALPVNPPAEAVYYRVIRMR